MPELPEIETIKSVIEPQVKGLTIESITVNRPEVIAHPTADEFCKAAMGQNISSMTRRGKFVVQIKKDMTIQIRFAQWGNHIKKMNEFYYH